MNKWIKHKIKEIAQIVGGGTPSTANIAYWNGEIPWITPKDLSNYNNKYIKKGERNVTQLGLQNSSAKLLPKHAILFSSRAPIGYIAIAENELTTNQGFRSLICDNTKVDYLFMYYLLRLNKDELELKASGSTFRELSGTAFGDFEINLPPLQEQKTIAKILSDLDSKIEINQQMNKTLEEIGKTLFKRWFVDFEFPNEQGKPYKSSGGEMVYNEELKKEIPKEWDVKLLKDLVLLNKRGIPPKYVSGGIPVLNQRCVRDKIIFNDASIQYHDPKKIINSELYLKSFDILINSMGVGTLGRISQASVVNDKYLVHSCITIIRADPQKISPFLLGYYFKDIQSMIEDLGEGSTGQTSLDNKKLDNLLVVVPDKKIQDKLDVLFNSIILEIGELDYENIKLAETRDLLLPKLMSGKIRVKYEK